MSCMWSSRSSASASSPGSCSPPLVAFIPAQRRQGRLDRRGLGRHLGRRAAIAIFAAAQALGGSGFVACFVGGVAFRAPPEAKHPLLVGAEAVGDGLALITWVVFGAGVIWQVADRITPAAVLYAVLSLTVIRMLPVWLSLAGTALTAADKLFIGWFGPRGLASIVFGILILDADLPKPITVWPTVVVTILLSVIAHGITANPLVRRFGMSVGSGTPKASPADKQ